MRVDVAVGYLRVVGVVVGVIGVVVGVVTSAAVNERASVRWRVGPNRRCHVAHNCSSNMW